MMSNSGEPRNDVQNAGAAVVHLHVTTTSVPVRHPVTSSSRGIEEERVIPAAVQADENRRATEGNRAERGRARILRG